ncbi:PEGA domain-containing protein [candidate division KSB1 bacterium]|nr:PEGA domain-containing protein [candidate division KSB1 bacterium]
MSCTTKEGNIVSYNPEFGNLLVTSVNYYGARIFLDYKDTGEETPALLENVPAGEHVVHVFLATTKPTPDSALVTVEEGWEKTVQFELNRVTSGDLQITTVPDSARVYINRLDFGYTPLNLPGIPEGNYRIQIWKSNYQPVQKDIQITSNQLIRITENLILKRVVLLEHFSNTNCLPCPQADAIVDELLDSYGIAQIIAVGYHTNSPSPFDPMYLSGKDGNDSRMLFYQLQSIPRAYVDGEPIDSPLDEQSYRTLIETHLQQSPSATIALQQLERGDTLISGRIQVKALQDLPSGTVLHIALIEDVIDYQNPPGTNGQMHFEAVFRDFYTDEDVQPVDLFSGMKIHSDFQFALKSQWGQDLTVVAFLQDLNTKQVLQAAWTRYPRF